MVAVSAHAGKSLHRAVSVSDIGAVCSSRDPAIGCRIERNRCRFLEVCREGISHGLQLFELLLVRPRPLPPSLVNV